MSSSMFVHLYKVNTGDRSRPLSTLLQQIRDTPLADRNRIVSKQDVRLEDVDFIDGKWHMDFGKIRYTNGPGKASRDRPIVGFEMDEDEGFGEETAAIYDPETGFAVIQYNHYGVRVGTIEEYLTAFDSVAFNSYGFAVQFDRDVDARLARKTFFRRLSFKLHFSKLTDDHRRRGNGLRSIIDLEDTFNTGYLDISMHMPRGSEDGLESSKITQAIDWFRGVVREDDKAISKFEVYAGNDKDAAVEVINLVKPRLAYEFTQPDLVLGPDRRYTRRSRFDVLARALHGWGAYIRG